MSPSQKEAIRKALVRAAIPRYGENYTSIVEKIVKAIESSKKKVKSKILLYEIPT